MTSKSGGSLTLLRCPLRQKEELGAALAPQPPASSCGSTWYDGRWVWDGMDKREVMDDGLEREEGSSRTGTLCRRLGRRGEQGTAVC
jgi:hypothetical protein